jgi:hypothetical protein
VRQSRRPGTREGPLHGLRTNRAAASGNPSASRVMAPPGAGRLAGPGAPVRRNACLQISHDPSRDAAADGSPAPRASLRRSRLRNGFACTIPRRRETTMATAAERMRAHRERARRGLRRFTISVSADDLPVIAEHGYRGTARSGSLLSFRNRRGSTTTSSSSRQTKTAKTCRLGISAEASVG